METKKVRTRFAPSPTGFIHLGALRTALYTYCIAKKQNGTFILRIEDTDQGRFVPGAAEAIYDALRLCGLIWDEGPDIGGEYGPYIQSERKALYADYAEELVRSGDAYYCFCGNNKEDNKVVRRPQDKCPCRELTHEESSARAKRGKETESYVVRQKIPLTGTTSFEDEIYGTVTFPNEELDDQILLKTDKMPTYNFANVIDDHLMEITHIVRGNEYLSSTPKYNLLYKSFGWEPPVYIHVEQIMRDERHKLSKRDGDAYFGDFTEKGYLVPAIINYIALLGWAPKGENEIFTLPELVEAFDLPGISKSPAIFDPAKLRAVNAMHIRTLSHEDFKALALPLIKKVCRRGDLDFDVLVKVLQPRCEVLTDIAEQIDFIEKLPEYDAGLFVSKKAKTTAESSREALAKIREVLERIPEEEFRFDDIHGALLSLAAALSLKNGQVLSPLRVALSGKVMTPGGGSEIAAIIGKTETLRRIDRALLQLSPVR